MNNSYEAGRNNAKWNMKTNRSSHPLLRRWTTTLTRSRPMRQCSPEARTPCSIRDRETWPILKKRKIGIINAFKSFRAFYSFAHWHAQSSQPTGLQTCDNHINLDLNKFFSGRTSASDAFPILWSISSPPMHFCQSGSPCKSLMHFAQAAILYWSWEGAEAKESVWHVLNQVN